MMMVLHLGMSLDNLAACSCSLNHVYYLLSILCEELWKHIILVQNDDDDIQEE